MRTGWGGQGPTWVGERPEEARREDPTDTCLLSPSPFILPSSGLLLPQPPLTRQGRPGGRGRAHPHPLLSLWPGCSGEKLGYGVSPAWSDRSAGSPVKRQPQFPPGKEEGTRFARSSRQRSRLVTVSTAAPSAS